MSSPAHHSVEQSPRVPEELESPKHVAIIMDGNGRWGNERGMHRSEGHRAGVENVRRTITSFADHGVKYLTLFAFSTENWERPDDEVGFLISLMGEAVRQETQPLHAQGVRIRHIGRLDRLPDGLQDAIRESMELTKDNNGITLNLAYDYGGRAEIIDAVRAMVADGLRPDDITEDVLQRHLYTAGMPDPDLIIRTAGEMRISNFLIWQAAYAEYYATDVHWPDFDERQVAKALEAYGGRQRRYGRLDPNKTL
ncbi:MAG: polyprenyl diphosphate synthase [SAR202 cluster bacterium]|nr:polyprenyl diphosphate synthase [SAR202 cluster bacterium]